MQLFKKQKFSDKNSKAKWMYLDQPSFKSVWNLCVMGVLTSLFFALFTFIDKLMLIDLVPLCSHWTFMYVYGKDFSNIGNTQQAIEAVFAKYSIQMYTPDQVIKDSISLTFAFNSLLYAIPALYSMGVAIKYTQNVAKGNVASLKEIWVNGFYGTLMFTLTCCIILLLLVNYILPFQTSIQEPTKTIAAADPKFYADLKVYYTQIYNDSVQYAKWFLDILGGTLLLSALTGIFNAVIRGEGEVVFATVISILAICINILFDFILIYVAQIAMLGAAVATAIGWVIQTVILAIYLSKKYKHHVSFMDWFKNVKLNVKVIRLLALFGSSIFISEVGWMIANYLLVGQLNDLGNRLLPHEGGVYVLSMFGMISPILALFMQPMFGFLQYNSQYFSYNYARYEFKRFQDGVWALTLYAFIYSCVVYIIICCIPGSAYGILSWFHLDTKNSYDVKFAVELLQLQFLQIPLYSLIVCALLVFLSSNRPFEAIFVNVLRTFIVFIPFIYIFRDVAIKTNDIWWFFSTNALAYLVSGVIVYVWTVIFTLKDVAIYKTHSMKKYDLRGLTREEILAKMNDIKQ